MSLNVRPFEVDPDDPHANDALGREKDCVMLADLIEETGGPFTLAVDAEWGDGKTVFIRMLEAHLAKRGFRCVSFSAWECDFCEEPLAPLIAEIGGQASKDAPTLKKKIKTKGNKLYGCFKKVVAAAHPVAGAVVESVEELAGGEEAGGYDFMTPYEEYRSALEGFRECLEAFSLEEGNGRPLVVLIDELDRCRPDFAVNFLERVKHVFDVPSLVFVMAVNGRELASVVKSFYGCGDGEKYLEKFFDLVFHLRNERTLIGASMREVATGRFLDRVRPWSGGQATLQEELHLRWFAHYLDFLSRAFGFSLRVQQKLVRALCVALMTVRRFDLWYGVLPTGFFDVRSHTALGYPLICYFLALRVANPDLFHRSVESNTVEAFPWEEHIRFYLYKLGAEKSLDTDADIDLHLLNPVNSKEDTLRPQDRTLDVLHTVRPDGRNLICLSLIALASSWSDAFSTRRIRDWDGIAEATGAIREILHARIEDYRSFREFLKAIDFAGKFYEPRNENS